MTAQNQRGEQTPKHVQLAEFRVIGPGASGTPIAVHFNPESLEYTVTNNIKEQGNSSESKQQVSKSSGKLSMELVYDTTRDGADVREQTEQLQALMKPVEEGSKKIAPIVEFAWGTYRFKGIFSSYKETLDYFSSTGVPLRASISISMTQQDGVFDPSAKGDAVDVDDTPVFTPPGEPQTEDKSDKGPATGDPAVDRGLAEDNDEDNPRFFSGKELSVPSGPDLQPPAAFAGGGFGLGLELGLDVGIGLDVGFSAGVSAGVSIGLGIEAGIDIGLSAGFEVDIGIDIGFEATVDVGLDVQVDGVASHDVDAGAGAAAGIGATSGVSSGVAGPSRTTGRAPIGAGGRVAEAAGGSGDGGSGFSGAFGGFASGEYRGPGSAPRTPPGAFERGPRGPGDHASDELPLGPRFGGTAAAGVPAALGAFAGLRTVRPRRRRPSSLSKLRGARPERALRTDTGASFEIGGRALDRSPNGLGTDVGARASLTDRIAFDDASGED